MEFIKCNNCHFENKSHTHYCSKCGNNISKTIEKTDIIRLLSILTKIATIIAFIWVILKINFVIFINVLYTLSKDDKIGFDYFSIIIFVSLLIISVLLNKYYKNLCMKNLSKIERNDINE